MPVNDDVASLAFSVAASGGQGDHTDLYLRLTTLLCWDAAMWCASRRGGVVLPDPDPVYEARPFFSLIEYGRFDGLFPPAHRTHVPTANDVYNIPVGAFVAFFECDPGATPRPKHLRHAMLYCLAGHAAGSHNDTIFPNTGPHWNTRHLTDFFGTPAYTVGRTHLFYTPCTGQAIPRP